MRAICLLTTASIFAAISLTANAQKGMGDEEGVARGAEQPPVEVITGKVTGTKVGPCESTTGHYPVGTHLFVQAEDGTEYNVHLGPDLEVNETAAILKEAETVTFRVFRTEKHLKGHFVAVSAQAGGKTYTFRDESLRPVWAGQGKGSKRKGRGSRGKK